MKKTFPNLTDNVVAGYIRNLAASRKLKRHWGTTTVGGVEVFNGSKIYYPDMDESTEKLAKFLGMHNDLSRPMEGVKRAWMYLNAGKAKDSFVGWNANSIASNLQTALDRVVASGGIVNVTIGAKVERHPNSRSIKPPTIDTPTYDQLGIISEILDEYLSLWRAGYAISGRSLDPYIQMIGMYALRTSELNYTVEKVTKSVSLLDSHTKLLTGSTFQETETNDAYVLQLKFDPVQPSIGTTSTLVASLRGDLLSATDTTSKWILRILSGESVREYGYTPVEVTPSSYWVTIPGYGTYLRGDFFEDSSVKLEEKVKYFTSSIDFDYKEEDNDASWFEIIVAVVIVVVSVVLANPGGIAAASGVLGTTVAIASVLTVAALYISVAMYALSLMGATRVAGAMGQFLKAVDGLVQVAGVVMIINSVVNFVRGAAQEAATAAAKEGVQQSMADTAVSAVKSSVTKLLDKVRLSALSTEHIVKMLDFTFDIYKDWDMRNLEREIADYRTEAEQLREAEERTQTSDVIKDYMANYPQLIAQDASVYADRYDRPYEWWSTAFHTGNIQATTVSALWLSK